MAQGVIIKGPKEVAVLAGLIRILQWVERRLFPDVIAVSFFALAFVWMTLEAVARRFFNHSIEFSDEVVTFALLIAVFLYLAQAGREGRHVSIDLLVGRLGEKNRFYFGLFAAVMGLLWGLALFASSLKFIPHLLAGNVVSSSSLRLPLWAVYTVLLLGGLLLALFYLESIVSLVRRRPAERSCTGVKDESRGL